jgi:alanyl-tRNA synthetase
MPKTERLYYTDSYLREFEAHVLKVAPATKGFQVYLNRTVFYPDSGGQPADLGSLGEIRVVQVVDEGDEIAHILERSPEKEIVKGTIDWRRRFDHMQQHTGQHILSAAFVRTGGYKTVSFHMGAEASTIDLDSDRLGRRQIDEAEDLANQVVFENRPVRVFFQSPAEANQMELRKPTSREGDIRLIEVQDFDLSACGGTHVNQSGGVGLIAVRKVERMKGLMRVEFVCGARALRACRRDFNVLSEAGRLLSAALEDVPELITKQMQDLRETQRAKGKLMERLAEEMARELWAVAQETNERRIVRQVFAAEDSRQAKIFAHALSKHPSVVALVGVKGKPAALYFAQSAGGNFDMGNVLKQVVAKFGGKGGGTRDFGQGGGLDENTLEDILSYAQALLK